MRSIRSWMINLALWPRMALAIGLGFLTLFAAFTFLSERAVHASTKHLLNERLVIAQMAANQIDRLLQEAVTELEQAHRFTDFALTSTNHEEAAELLAAMYGRIGIFTHGIAYVDANGRSVLSHPPDLYLSETDLTHLAYVQQALQTQTTTISEPFTDPASDLPVTAVTIPIFAGDQFLGLLSGLIDLNSEAIISPLQEAAALGETGHATLVDAEGHSLVSTYDVPFLSPSDHSSFYQNAMRQPRPLIDTIPLELDLPGETLGEEHIMAFVPLQNAPWAVAVGGDSHETFADVSQLRAGLAAAGMLVLTVLLALTLSGTRRLLRPIPELTTAAQKIAAGELDIPLHVTQAGEIGTMAKTLEHMRQQLLANIEELAHWNETLEYQVRERTKDLRQQQHLTQRLLRQVITAQEEERARLARELHDEIGQMLTAVKLSLERLSYSNPASLEQLERVKTLTDRALADLRRVITAMRPGVLDELGLVPALEWMSDHTLRPLGIKVSIEAVGLADRLPGEIATTLFRIAQEAMNNVAQHSQASQVTIHLGRDGEITTMSLADNGRGWNQTAVSLRSFASRGLGLAGMRERALLVGGHLEVSSTPGQGTVVRVSVHLPATHPAGEEVEENEHQAPQAVEEKVAA